MPRLNADRSVESICAELDPERFDMIAPLLDALDDPTDRRFMTAHLRRILRAELIVGIEARAFGDSLVKQGVASPAAVGGWLDEDLLNGRKSRPVYVRSNLLSYNLGRVDEASLHFYEVVGRCWDRDALQTVYDWLDLAHDRLFGSMSLRIEGL